ncbi:MAG: hypothetical protein QF664_05630 [Dehalococcoidia bacterium]|jgi:hypothetical protein|nr:hypothetical protein [Dehalococcoidia bacterium]
MRQFDGTSLELSQFDLRFELSCEVSYWFDHVSRLAEPFASLAPAEGVRDTRNAMAPIRVEVKAGDLIGYSSGTVPAHVWDFVLVNTAVTVRFANQQRYETAGDLRSLLHAVCPADYLAPALRAEYVALYGSWTPGGQGTGCDTAVDLVGTIAGGWFQTPFDASNSFAGADWGVVASIAGGGEVDVNGPGRSVRTAPSDPTFADPKLVTGEHCFQNSNQPSWAYLKVLSDSELGAAFGDGACPLTFPSDYRTFYR